MPFNINSHWQNFFDVDIKILYDLNMILPFYLVVASFRAYIYIDPASSTELSKICTQFQNNQSSMLIKSYKVNIGKTVLNLSLLIQTSEFLIIFFNSFKFNNNLPC